MQPYRFVIDFLPLLLGVGTMDDARASTQLHDTAANFCRAQGNVEFALL